MLRFDFKPLKKWLEISYPRKIRKGLEAGFVDAMDYLTRYSRVHHPSFKNRSRKLARSLTATTKGTKGNISSDVFYSKYLYFGTKDHFIKPVKAKALSWSQGGKTMFSNGHMVSGIKKSHWIETNYKKKSSVFILKVEKAVIKEFK